MKKPVFLICLLIIVGACSSHRAVVVQPFQGRLSDFRTLEIPEFTTTLRGELDQEVLNEIPNQTVTKLRDENLFQEVTRRTDSNESVLVMEGVVISYEKGSRAKRYFVGLGAGKAYCTVQCTFRNKANNQELATINFEGELSGGLFGGGADETAEGVVNAIVDYFKQNYN